MKIAFLVYEGMTALDIIGPYEVLARLPGADIQFVSKTPEVRVDTGAFSIGAPYRLSDCPQPDGFVVPGGSKGTRVAAADEEILDWVRAAHEQSQFTASVCTGSLILGAAGLLDGLQATTHWAAVDELERYGARYTAQRVVQQGRIFTAAGVSAGIDMALTLLADLKGEDMARIMQLAIEYDPEPPFDAGSPQKAGPELMRQVAELFARYRE